MVLNLVKTDRHFPLTREERPSANPTVLFFWAITRLGRCYLKSYGDRQMTSTSQPNPKARLDEARTGNGIMRSVAVGCINSAEKSGLGRKGSEAVAIREKGMMFTSTARRMTGTLHLPT